MENRRVFISAGEVSGDIVGARLVAELRRRDSGASVVGTGGPRMRRAGVDIICDTSNIGVVGVTEVVRTLPWVAAAYLQIRRRVAERRPDVAVLIGNDAFNVVLARWLRRRRIPTIAYFPPQVWLWRSLLRPIARSFDAILTSFPDEHHSYTQAHPGGDVRFVGHYLASELHSTGDQDRLDARARLGVDPGTRILGLLPGSRLGEIAALARVLLDAAARLEARDADLRFVLATTEATDDRLRTLIAAHPMSGRIVVTRESHALMRSADLVLLASGTASLECALLGTPMVIVYKVSAVTNLIARLAIRVGLLAKYETGLPNLLLGEAAVPEVLQRRATPATIAAEAWAVLSSNDRRRAMRDAFLSIRQQLHSAQPIGDVADIVLEWAGRTRAAVTPAGRWVPPTLRAVERK